MGKAVRRGCSRQTRDGTDTYSQHFPRKSPLSEQSTRVLSEIKNTYAENTLVVAKTEEGSRGEMNWDFRVSICKLLYIRWINDKALLYTTRNHVRYPMINHNGKEYEKECINIKLNHLAV